MSRAGCTSAFTLRSYGGADIIGDALGYYTQPLYASVNHTGGFWSGISSGAVSATNFATGQYRVGFNRPVEDCDVQVSHANFPLVADVSVDQTLGSDETVVHVLIRDVDGNLTNSFFNILVTC